MVDETHRHRGEDPGHSRQPKDHSYRRGHPPESLQRSERPEDERDDITETDGGSRFALAPRHEGSQWQVLNAEEELDHGGQQDAGDHVVDGERHGEHCNSASVHPVLKVEIHNADNRNQH